MPNNYYTFGGPFIPNTKVRSGQVNPEFEGVESGFDLLPGASDAITRGVTELGIDVQGGTVNEFDVAMPDTRLTNQEGDLVAFRATHTNDGPVVINVDTIGDIAAVEFDGSAFAGGELVTGRVYEFRYDNANTQFVLSQSTDGANQVIAAEDWAIRPEDDPIPVSSGGDGVTDFSALHWANKSAAFGGGLDFAGDHDASSGDPASPATGNPLYRIITSGGVITGAGQVEIGDDIYWNGVDWNRINNQGTVFVAGTSADDPTSPGSFDSNLEWQNVNGAPLANVGFNTDQQFGLINRVHGGGLRLAGEASAGSVETYLTGNDGAGTTLHFAGIQKFATAADSIIINDSTTNDPTAGLTQLVNIDARNGSFAPVFHVGHQGGLSLDIKNFVHTNADSVRILGEQTTGAEVLFAVFGFVQGAQLYDQGDLSFSTGQTGVVVHAQAPNNTVIMEMDLINDVVGELFYSAGEFAVEAGIDVEALMNLYATDAALNEVIMATLDAETGPVTLNHSDAAGSVVSTLRTASLLNGGAEVNNTVTGAGFERVLGVSDISGGSPFTEIILTNSNGIDLVDTNVALNIGAADPDSDPHLELGISAVASELAIQAKATNTTVAELEINRLGGNVRVGSQNSAVAGGTFLYASNGVANGAVIETVISGMILEGKTGANTILDFHAVNSTLAMRVVYNGGNFQFEGFVNSEEIRFQSRNSGAAVRELIFLDPDDDVEIYHPASDRVAFRTTALGADIRADAAGDPALTLTEDTTLSVTLQHIASSDITILKNEIDSGHVQIRGEDSGSADTLMAEFDPDGLVGLGFDGASVARTITAATGGFEINNTLTGAGFERALTVSDLSAGAEIGGFVSDVEPSDTNLPDATPITVLSVALEANTSYAVDFYLEVLADATDNFRFTVDDPGGATWNGNGLVIASTEASPLNMDSISFIMNVTGAASVIGISGTMNVVTDGNAGALTLDASKQADASVDGTFRLGSWIRAQKLD